MRDIDRVAAAGEVEVMTGPRRIDVVVGSIVKAAEEAGGSIGPGLAGVVVDDVEDHFESGPMEGLDHVAELGHGIARGGITGLGGEKAEGVVAPVVHEAAFEEETVVEMLVHGQELHRGDAKIAEVAGRGRVGESGIRAPERLGNAGIKLGEALHMHLADHRLRHRSGRRRIVFPIIGME